MRLAAVFYQATEIVFDKGKIVLMLRNSVQEFNTHTYDLYMHVMGIQRG